MPAHHQDSGNGDPESPMPPQPQQQQPQSAADLLVQTLLCSTTLPKPELLVFDGSPRNWSSFITNFTTNVAARVGDDSVKLSYLIQHCSGEAKTAIKDCVMLEPTSGYETALNILKERFGSNHVVARTYIDDLIKGPKVAANEVEDLVRFASNLRSTYIVLSQLKFTSDMDASDTLRQIVKRLPYHIQGKWVEKAAELVEVGQEPRFADLVTFVEARARVASTMFGRDYVSQTRPSAPTKQGNFVTMAARTQPGEQGSYKTNNNKDNRNGASGDTFKQVKKNEETTGTEDWGSRQYGKACPYCDLDNHALVYCRRFARLTIEEKIEVIKQNRLCFRCLEPGHIARDCEEVCGTCGRRHHELIHDQARDRQGHQQE